MNHESHKTFGLVIAYVIPGFVVLHALAPFSATVQSWLGSGASDRSSMADFFYMLLASVGAGLTASTVRWLILDSLHATTGVRAPDLDFSRLAEHAAAFELVVEHHYRYYQFYGNSLIAIGLYAAVQFLNTSGGSLSWAAWSLLAGIAVLFAVASRDALQKYYARLSGLTIPISVPPIPEGEMS